MEISKFPEFPKWVGFFESMDEFADKVRLFWKRNDRKRAKLKKKEAKLLQAKTIAERKVSKNDLKQVLAEISKVIDEQSDPEEFKDQITSIVKKSMIKSKTSRVHKPRPTKLVAMVTKTKSIKSTKPAANNGKQTKVDHEPETILITGKNVRDQTDSDNDSIGHKPKRHKVDEVVTPQNKQSTRTSGKKCPRVESDSDNDPIQNESKKQKGKPP